MTMVHGNCKHGMVKTPEYAAWRDMRYRCNNKNHAAYGNYGGRGISVCSRWNDSFEAFLEDMGDRPSSAHSLERVDNQGNYSPENCEWADCESQNRNRRNVRRFEFKGRLLTLPEICEDTGLSYHFLHRRIVRLGWPVELAVNAPCRSIRNGHRGYNHHERTSVLPD